MTGFGTELKGFHKDFFLLKHFVSAMVRYLRVSLHEEQVCITIDSSATATFICVDYLR